MSTARLCETFSALSDTTRLTILSQLLEGPANVGELSRPFSISPPAISRHLKVLESAGLIQRVRNRQQWICSIRPEGFVEASRWIEQYRQSWSQQFDALDRQLQARELDNDE
ncbi:metalloregulator ArsR/SmtB family transcription factor [Chloroflexi bacterium TSY]|nr:metalloregulator ArsR/SmtB family transcription factor [Chloroflexi bacterium TSY]